MDRFWTDPSPTWKMFPQSQDTAKTTSPARPQPAATGKTPQLSEAPKAVVDGKNSGANQGKQR
ncbi:hypothetical protein K491DRAFT_697078 [Lophiostoma macrostomum CBS 122681]|uniref:Uncharacterized protein n=1 Tax=Lophiostoma macrostomum CBS 122681 TaxID=1314788 RepID=A0A6A6SSR0_9PLEO|nr:hypothetical protein K491DRAFT_697078 [Lophiostoma macrostomum CBS 122681]